MTAALRLPDGRTNPGTNRGYDLAACAVLTIRDGRFATNHAHWDRALMRGQLGLNAPMGPDPGL